MISLDAAGVALGLLMIYRGCSLYAAQLKLPPQGVETEGRIVGFQRLKVEHDDRRQDFVPVVMFKTESGEDVTFMGVAAEQFWTNYQMGKTVIVSYDPRSPWDAGINEFANIRYVPIMLILLGSATALISPYIIWRRRRDHTL